MAAPGPRQLISNTPVEASNFLKLSKEPKPPAAPSASIKPSTASDLLPKLRWANIGWFYHWGTKQYDFTRPKVDIEEPVRSLCKEVIRSISWRDVYPSNHMDGWDVNEPHWKEWENTYGSKSSFIQCRVRSLMKFHIYHRTRCRDCQLLSAEGKNSGMSSLCLLTSVTRIRSWVTSIVRRSVQHHR